MGGVGGEGKPQQGQVGGVRVGVGASQGVCVCKTNHMHGCQTVRTPTIPKNNPNGTKKSTTHPTMAQVGVCTNVN